MYHGHIFNLPQEVKQQQQTLISPIKCHSVSAREVKERFEEVKKNIMVDESEIKVIEEKTRGQSNLELWHSYRKPRITATKCYRVAAQRETTSPTKSIEDILNFNKTYQSKSMEEGLAMEDKIIDDYKLFKQSKGLEILK